MQNGVSQAYQLYLPFGELFVNQGREFDIRYKFSAKELNNETGYSYFGAGMHCDLLQWVADAAKTIKSVTKGRFNNTAVQYVILFGVRGVGPFKPYGDRP